MSAKITQGTEVAGNLIIAVSHRRLASCVYVYVHVILSMTYSIIMMLSIFVIVTLTIS